MGVEEPPANPEQNSSTPMETGSATNGEPIDASDAVVDAPDGSKLSGTASVGFSAGRCLKASSASLKLAVGWYARAPVGASHAGRCTDKRTTEQTWLAPCQGAPHAGMDPV